MIRTIHLAALLRHIFYVNDNETYDADSRQILSRVRNFEISYESAEFIELLKIYILTNANFSGLTPSNDWIKLVRRQSDLTGLTIGTFGKLQNYRNGKIFKIIKLLNDMVCIDSRKHVTFLDISGDEELEEKPYEKISQLFPNIACFIVGRYLTWSNYRSICTHFSNLKKLDISDTEITSLRGTAQLKLLETLIMRNIELKCTDAFWELCKLEKLKILDIGKSKSIERRMELINLFNASEIRLKHLLILDCSGTDVTKESLLQFLGNHDHIKTVYALRTQHLQVGEWLRQYPIVHSSSVDCQLEALQYYVKNKMKFEIYEIVKYFQGMELRQMLLLNRHQFSQFMRLVCDAIKLFPKDESHLHLLYFLENYHSIFPPNYCPVESPRQICENFIESLLICIQQWLPCRSSIGSDIIMHSWNAFCANKLWEAEFLLDEACTLAMECISTETKRENSLLAMIAVGHMIPIMKPFSTRRMFSNLRYRSVICDWIRFFTVPRNVRNCQWIRSELHWTALILFRMTERNIHVCTQLAHEGFIDQITHILQVTLRQNFNLRLLLLSLLNIFLNCTPPLLRFDENLIKTLLYWYNTNLEEMNGGHSQMLHIFNTDVNHIILSLFAHIVYYTEQEHVHELNAKLVLSATQINLNDLNDGLLVYCDNQHLRCCLLQGRWEGLIVWALKMVRRRMDICNDRVRELIPLIRQIQLRDRNLILLKNEILCNLPDFK